MTKLFTFFATFALGVQTAHGQDDPLLTERTLCHEGEDIYFSCKFESSQKIISLCAAKNHDPDHGYVQYRYGTPEKIDFAYPDRKAPPNGNFVISDVSEGSVRGLHVKFKSGNFNYVIFSIRPSGVYVLNNGNAVFNRYCGQGRHSGFHGKSFKGINWSPPDDLIDFGLN